jgi:hypothetical protein
MSTDEIARLTAERDMLRSMIETLTHMPPETLRGLNMLAAERDAARAQAAALAEAIRTVVETDDHFVAAETWRPDGVPSKHDKCAHGNHRYDGCESCAAEFLSATLAAYDAQKETGDDRS